MFTKILVPVDGSELGDRALPYAIRLAQAAHGELSLMRAVSEQEHAPKGRSSQLQAVQDHLNRLASQARVEGVTVRFGIEYDLPPEAVLRAARSNHADLIVMSTHARSEVQRWYRGSVADDVVRSADIPALLIPPECAPAWPRAGMGFILVPLDGSDLAAEALGPASQLAADLDCGLRLLHVVQPSAGSPEGERYLAEEDPDVRVAAARQLLDEYLAQVHARGLQAEVATAMGFPAHTIALEARRPDVRAIVMATHGRGGLLRNVMGSAATGVLLRTCLPLMLVRPEAARMEAGRTTSQETPVEARRPVAVTLEPSERVLLHMALAELLATLEPAAPLTAAVRALTAKLSSGKEQPAAQETETGVLEDSQEVSIAT